MPELPEVENVVRSLSNKDLVGQTIVKVEPTEVCIKYNELDEFSNRVEGKQIFSIARRGKFIKMYLSPMGDGELEVLIVHLAMTGAFLYIDSVDKIKDLPPNIYNHIFLKLHLSNGGVLLYSDYRRFGSVRVVTDAELELRGSYSHLKTIQDMGAEPFDPQAFKLFLNAIRQRRYEDKIIKDVLLDQRVVAGVGNIYASECLVKAGVKPDSVIASLSDESLLAVFNDLIDILERSISSGGTSIKDYVNADGESGSFADQLLVYNQQNCRICGTGVETFYYNNRKTFYCPSCQTI